MSGCDKAYATTTKLRRHLRVYHKLTELDKSVVIPEGATDDAIKPAALCFTGSDIDDSESSLSKTLQGIETLILVVVLPVWTNREPAQQLLLVVERFDTFSCMCKANIQVMLG